MRETAPCEKDTRIPRTQAWKRPTYSEITPANGYALQASQSAMRAYLDKTWDAQTSSKGELG